MRTIADRYILKEVLAPFLLGVGAFVVILIGDILHTLAEFIATRRVAIRPSPSTGGRRPRKR